MIGGYYHDNPFESILGSYVTGLNIKRTQDQNKYLQAQEAHNMSAMQALEGLDFDDENAVRQFVARYPEYGKGAKEYVAGLDEKRHRALLADMSQTIALLQNKRSDLAVQRLGAKAQAFRNSGDEKTALEYEEMADWISTDTTSAYNGLVMSYATLTDKDSASNYKAVLEANRPTTDFKNAGDRFVPVTTDPITGEVSTGEYDGIGIGVSPDAQVQQDTAIITTGMNNDTSRYVSDNSRAASEYGADRSYQGTVYASDNNLKGTIYSADKGYEGTVYSTDGSIQRAQIEAASRERIEQAKLYYQQQQDEIRNNQAEFKEWNGQVFIVYKNGDFKVALDENGQPMTTGSVKLNESQAKSNVFVSRMANAHQGLLEFEKQGISAPVIAHAGEYGNIYATVAPRWLGGANEKQRQYMQYQRDFVNAVLRLESGAVINEREFENAIKQYFPRIGDSRAVIEQKQRNRQVAIDAIRQGLPVGYGNAGANSQQKPLSYYFTGE